jgi:hypothetical protein
MIKGEVRSGKAQTLLGHGTTRVPYSATDLKFFGYATRFVVGFNHRQSAFASGQID